MGDRIGTEDNLERKLQLPLQYLRDITNNFSSDRELGRGGFGVVYKGIEVQSGAVIAVKKLKPILGEQDRQFKNEVNHLARLSHDNIVKLIGYCDETKERPVYDEDQKKYILAEVQEKLLCYEYLSKGSLDNIIFDESLGLDWQDRYKIINGICQGLHYLHEGLDNTPIIHLDLKPSNILLDDRMEPKLADFGLSRLFSEEQTRTCTMNLMGSIGYMAPEYLLRGEISTKSDIYSLGILILEIVTGKKNHQAMGNRSGEQFIEDVRKHWTAMPRIASKYPSLGSDCLDQVYGCIEIGLCCVEADQEIRPSSGQILLYMLSRERMYKADCEIQKGLHDNLQGFLDAVDQLRSIEHFFSSNRCYRSNDGVLNHVNAILSKALLKMEGEFQNQLSQHSKPMEPDHLFDCLRPKNQQNSEAAIYSPPVLIESKFVPLLSKLAQQLVQARRQHQCSEIYSKARASALESSLKIMGVKELSKTEAQKMPWEVLESKIGNWLHFMRIAIKLLFAGERQLCDQVFECSQFLRDKCFAAITKNSFAILLSFGEAITMCERSPDSLFVLLDMYEIMSEIDTIFVGESCYQMRESALSLMKCLAEMAQKTLSDFEEAVENDPLKYTSIDGSVERLTIHVTSYVKFLFDYQSTLKQLFQEFKTEDGTCSELAAVIMKIMQGLQNNLDAKAKRYKDPALMHIFLMNNIHYIDNHRSQYKDLLGDDWNQRHRSTVQQNLIQYRRIAWSKVLQCLSGQGLTSAGGSFHFGNRSGVSRAAVKERFRSFNVLFEEIYQKQCSWLVPDTMLREALKLSIAEILIPAYRSFTKRFGPLIENTKAPDKYMKHTPDQLELLLDNLFEGKQERA